MSGTRSRAMLRAASIAASQPGSAQASNRSTSGSGEVRSTTSVRIPSRPSEPSTIWRRSGPAADAGNGGIRIVPAGASRPPPAYRPSIRPRPKERSPEPRAATQPPTVASSNDWGSWPTVSPNGARCAARAGPVVPEPHVTRPLRSSRAETPARSERSTEITGSGIGRTVMPPTTLVPPPYGTRRAPRSRARSMTDLTPSADCGRATASGTAPRRPERRAIRSGKDWPRAWRTRASGSRSRRASSGAPAASRREGGTSATTSASVASVGGVPGPTRRSSHARGPSPRCAVSASSPQPFQRRMRPSCPNAGLGVCARRSCPVPQHWGVSPRCTRSSAPRMSSWHVSHEATRAIHARLGDRAPRRPSRRRTPRRHARRATPWPVAPGSAVASIDG